MTFRIPDVPSGLDTSLTTFLKSLKDAVETHEGLRSEQTGFIKRADLSEDWQQAVLLDSWVRYAETSESPSFCKMADGTVVIKGTVASGTTGATARVFILPDGYRPGYKISVPVITNSGIGQVDIEATGEVRPISGGTTWFSLSNISFRA